MRPGHYRRYVSPQGVGEFLVSRFGCCDELRSVKPLWVNLVACERRVWSMKSAILAFPVAKVSYSHLLEIKRTVAFLAME